MKSTPLYCALAFMLIAGKAFSQKPQKTFDHEKFAKKIILYMNSNDVSRYFADVDGIKYISEKTGRSKEDVSAEVEANKIKVAEDLKFLNDNGIYRIL